MESVKKSLINFCKGFGIWLVLLLLNTRSGEGAANMIKSILDIILAIILVGSYRNGRYIALLAAALTIVITFLPVPPVLEIILLIAIAVLGGVLLNAAPEDDQTDWTKRQWRRAHGIFKNIGRTFENSRRTRENSRQMWKSRNFLNPLETYSYLPDNGIHIRQGIIRRSYSTIPTTTTRIRIHQSVWQRLLGLCNISFQSNYSGKRFGEDDMRNIRLRSAKKLERMLS